MICKHVRFIPNVFHQGELVVFLAKLKGEWEKLKVVLIWRYTI